MCNEDIVVWLIGYICCVVVGDVLKLFEECVDYVLMCIKGENDWSSE